ncbi:unnamed protein product [Didymodactylos carnosus]|uniref:Protein kinase domain-containing protein n=1 Tax=Didymodactylos carnosus TaxID=1234261 RepID=A0A8S2HBL6_9BILA|nr:unnamed protein product [Didymodactylos carnosus]CAF3617225.1 unnamed protein product [Didymodactylos carnosus]
MAQEPTVEDEIELTSILSINHSIRQSVQNATNEFLLLEQSLMKNITEFKLDQSIQHITKPLTDSIKIKTLNQEVTSDKIHLALCGPNSSGKTSFLSLFLKIDNILPSGAGPVSARIVRLTYALPQDACLRVYKSLKHELSSEDLEETVELSEYFGDEENPDWEGIKSAIRLFVTRPQDKSAESDEFASWAKHFVEIRIPSSILKLGINVYDTPGFLFSDAPVLKDNLRQLVKEISPTLIFMYVNASVDSDTQDCFLALKETLTNIENTIFFLNTKVDVDRIFSDSGIREKNVTKRAEMFPRVLLAERQKRYNLLLQVPSMAKEVPGGLAVSLNDCDCFDVISVHSEPSPNGASMNRYTINRMIKFVANSDLKIAKKIIMLVLPAIDAFFDFALVTSHSTQEKLEKLRRNARLWSDKYFVETQVHFDQLLGKVFANILERLSEERESIASRAAKLKNPALIEQYVRAAVQQDVIKVGVNGIVEQICNTFLELIISNGELLNNTDRNEFLVAAQRSALSELLQLHNSQGDFLVRTVFLLMLVLIELLLDDGDDQNVRDQSILSIKLLLRETSSRKIRVDKSMNLLDQAHHCLSQIHENILDRKKNLNIITEFCIRLHKQQLLEKIDQHYVLALKFLPHREKAHNLAELYASQFARIECKLIAAKDFTENKGVLPQIDQSSDWSENILFSLHQAQWGNEKNLVVKRLKTPIGYLEAHYHQKITMLTIPNLQPLIYLYEKEDEEIWLFFPRYKDTLSRYIEDNNCSINLRQALTFCSQIAGVLNNLHSNDIAHGKINTKNIVLTDNRDVCCVSQIDTSASEASRYNLSSISEEICDDISAYGYVCLEFYNVLRRDNGSEEKGSEKIMQEFKRLIDKCLDEDITVRPKATSIVRKLKEMENYVFD